MCWTGNQAGGGGGPAPDPLEPSGVWFVKADNRVAWSYDGKNWDVEDYIGSTFYNSDYYWASNGSDVAFFGVDIVGNSFKTANKAIPDFTQNSGGAGPGLCQWIAFGPSGWVGRTTTQLRHSADAILWTDQDVSAPVNWGSINGGQFRYSPSAGLYMAFGSSFSVGFLNQYFTSPNRTTWTQRTFPTNWTANGQGGNVEWFIDNGSIAIMTIQTTGQIYSTTDGINWTLRNNSGSIITGACWNPIEGAFYVTQSAANPNNLLRSTDGINWSSHANNLDTFLTSGQIACDTVKNLMFVNTTSVNTSFQTTDSAVSSDGGTSWSERWARSGNSLGFLPFKLGPGPVSDTITITPDPFTAFDAQGTPTTSFARFIIRNDGTIDRQTAGAGIVQVGKWPAGAEDSLSPAGREYMLTQNSGSALNFGNSGLGVWRSANLQGLYGYTTTFGVLTGNFTLRVRDKITLVEDTNGGVSVTITAEST